jgi:CHASE2 domain-containing sensor protein
MLIKFADGMDNIKKDSAVDVLRDSGGIPSKTFKNKLVLVGITDAGIGSSFVTPVDSAYQFNGIVLSSLRNIWEGNFLSRPLWAPPLEYGWLALIGLFVTFLPSSNESQAGVGGDVGPWRFSRWASGLVFVFGQELVD